MEFIGGITHQAELQKLQQVTMVMSVSIVMVRKKGNKAETWNETDTYAECSPYPYVSLAFSLSLCVVVFD